MSVLTTTRAAKVARTAKIAAPTVVTPSPVLESLQALMKGKHGPATAVILAEIFGEPRGRKPMAPPRHDS
jgi:hypothetical protein